MTVLVGGIGPDDDWKFHRGDLDPAWNESSFFSFAVPERLLKGFVYFFFRPNMGFAAGGPAVFDPSGTRTWDCLLYDWDWPQEIPANAEALQFELRNGLRVDTVRPFEEYRIHYDAGDARTLELRWEAVTPQHTSVIGAGLEETGRAHYDQFGRMTGTITLGRERIAVDSYSIRDRSWGPRRMRVSPRGDYLWAVASPNHAFHAVAVGRPGDDHDQVVTGMLIRDGEVGDLVRGRRWAVQREGARPAVVRLVAEDSLGRTLEAEGRVASWLEWQGYGHQFEWWCLTEWEFDGITCWGEDQEFHPLKDMRDHVHRHRG